MLSETLQMFNSSLDSLDQFWEWENDHPTHLSIQKLIKIRSSSSIFSVFSYHLDQLRSARQLQKPTLRSCWKMIASRHRQHGWTTGDWVEPLVARGFPRAKKCPAKTGEQHGRIRGAFLFEFINMIVLQCFARLEVLDQWMGLECDWRLNWHRLHLF